MKKTAFSVAEAFTALLVVSIALGASAPMITKQLKTRNTNDALISKLQNDIEYLKTQIGTDGINGTDGIDGTEGKDGTNGQNSIPSGAIMFFNKTTCPQGWHQVTDKDGNTIQNYYPRIANEGDSDIGTTKEEMVKRHKHVSPFITHYSSTTMNALRYGPYKIPGSFHKKGFEDVKGDLNYPEPPNMRSDGNGHKIPKDIENDPFGFYGYGYPAAWHYDTFLYTSDGVNRTEKLFGIKNAYNMKIKNVLTCPNRDEGNQICKETGNQNGVPYLKEMALVGEENRPNSIVWLACEKN